MQIVEINTIALRPNDRLRVRVLRAKAKLAQMGFLQPTNLIMEHMPDRYSEGQIRLFINLRACDHDFTSELEKMVDVILSES
jgi:hypothetical protein